MGMEERIQHIKDTLEILPDWEERYRFIIDLGGDLEPLNDAERSESNRVRGCLSQVWLVADPPGADGTIHLRGDSDAHIVRGLVAILLTIYADKTPREIANTDIHGIFQALQLEQHITMNRRNGLYSIVETIQNMAQQRLAG